MYIKPKHISHEHSTSGIPRLLFPFRSPYTRDHTNKYPFTLCTSLFQQAICTNLRNFVPIETLAVRIPHNADWSVRWSNSLEVCSATEIFGTRPYEVKFLGASAFLLPFVFFFIKKYFWLSRLVGWMNGLFFAKFLCSARILRWPDPLKI